MHKLIADISKIVKPESIRTTRYNPLQTIPFYKDVKVPDANRLGEPYTVVRVTNVNEISTILKLANEKREPIYVRQAMGIITPDILRPEPPGCLAVDIESLDWIRPDFKRNYVEVGPATTEIALNKALAPHGFNFPELIGPVTWGTIIGLNSSGRSVDPNPKTGKPRDYVLGLQVVLPTGEIIETGTTAMRSPCGFDLTHLLIGSQCLLGVVTNVRLRLKPAPRDIIGAVVYFSSVQSFGEGVAAIYANRAPYPRKLEMMDKAYLTTMQFDGPVSAAMALLMTDGEMPGEAQWKLNEILQVLKRSGGVDFEMPSKERWIELEAFREIETIKLREQGKLNLIGDVLDVPLDKLSDALAEAIRIEERIARDNPGIITYNMGHIGSGSFHPSVAAPVAWGYERLKDLARHVRQQFLEFRVSFDGTIGEQGIFPNHREWFVRHNGRVQWELVKAVKEALDPNNILNPMRLAEDFDA